MYIVEEDFTNHPYYVNFKDPPPQPRPNLKPVVEAEAAPAAHEEDSAAAAAAAAAADLELMKDPTAVVALEAEAVDAVPATVEGSAVIGKKQERKVADGGITNQFKNG